MKIENVKTIAVCGAGTMGAGIAQMSAAAGFKTILYDINDEAVSKGKSAIDKNLQIGLEKNKITVEEKIYIENNIQITSNLKSIIADIVIEAIIEIKEVKQNLFSSIAEINSIETILATNTSSIPISSLADNISHPERVVGMHFFNPAHIMKLVEVISGNKTSIENAQCIYDLALKMNKTPVRANDRPGFIVNRIGKLYHTEPIRIVEEGIADVETIDELMEASGFKMGPFKLIDLIGVDANLNVTKSLYELMNHAPQFKPSELQQKMVAENKLGKKNGVGFYKY